MFSSPSADPPLLLNDAPASRRTTFLQGRKAAFVFSVLNIMNAIMGSGILALPAVLANNGIALFAILMFAIMGIVDFSLQLLVAAAAAVEQRSYEALGLAAFGYKGKLTVAISIMVQNTGANLSYLIVLGDLAPALFALFVGADAGAAALAAAPWWRSRDFLMAVGAAVFILPLACTRQIGFLGYASFASFAVMVCLAALAAVEFARIPCSAGPNMTDATALLLLDAAAGPTSRPCDEPVRVAEFGLDTALALPTLCFSFLCHTAFLPVLDELAAADALGRTARAAGRSAATAHVAIGLSGAIYLWTALWGYFTFGENVQSELWLSYNEAVPGDPLVTAVRFGFCISILCTVPLILFPMRKALTELLFAGRPFSWARHLALTAALLAAKTGLAIALPGIHVVFAVVGATSSVMLVFVLPATIYLRCVPADGRSRCTAAAARALLVLGVAVAALAIGAFVVTQTGAGG